MDFSDFVTHHGKRVNKDYFLTLIQVSKTDGEIAPEELSVLYKEGRKFGLTEPEIEKLIASEASHMYHAPYSLHEKFEHLYNVAVMILADEEVTDQEKKLLKRFAIESGFNDNSIEAITVLLLDGIQKNRDEDELFSEFKEVLFK
ncbi:MAG TPA: hypothetical protein VHO68_16135 [Bacteroidales bacterium]|jgi:tellurite resistance protein|nr:hypothetical protein [Bacteroidales bacterium]